MEKFYIRQGAGQPHYEAVIIDGAGVAIDLSGGIAFFKMQDPRTGSMVTSAAAVIDSATGGIVRYPWTATDVATPGIYKASFEVWSLTGGMLKIPRTPEEEAFVIVQP